MALTRIADQLGQVLGGRYRLLVRIGSGASGHVFLAEDVRLERQVAVKILQPALATDFAFLGRFRAEARSAAGLNHPHVCRVFDWGEDEDGPFLVMEYLSGGSLRDLLDAGQRLSAVQATTMGLQAASALDYAHRRGLVHRDIKPANLVFDEEGRPRIADFGIARALADTSGTEPMGSMPGTARYASPEQAQGKPLDGRSDVYALALVLVEAVTGQVPFTGESPHATLMGRVGVPLRIGEQLGPLGPVLSRAGAPDPADRLDAAGLVTALERLARTLPRPRPLPLVSEPASRAGGVSEPASRAGGVSEPASRAGGVFEPADLTVPDLTVPDLTVPDLTLPDLTVLDGYRPGWPESEPVAVPGDSQGARRRWPWILLALVVPSALAAAGALVAQRPAVLSHPVPALRDILPAKAVVALAPEHLRLVQQGSRYDPAVPAGAIADQSPLAGAMAQEGRTVTVVLSAGPAPQAIPDLSNLDQTAAIQRLDNAGLTASVVFAHSDTIPSGTVLDWTPHAGLESHDTLVTVTVSLGPALVKVPNVTTQTVQEATAALAQLGLSVGGVYGPVHNGPVILTNPTPGTTVHRGTAVTLFVL